MKILIIDDDPQKSNLLRDILHKHDVTTEHNYIDALSRIKTKYDAILCDYFFDREPVGGKLLDAFIAANSCRMAILYSGNKSSITHGVYESTAYDFGELVARLPMLIENMRESDHQSEHVHEQTKPHFGRRADDGEPKYNRELCDMRHEEDKRERTHIQKSVDKLAEDIEKLTVKTDQINGKFLAIAVAMILQLLGISGGLVWFFVIAKHP